MAESSISDATVTVASLVRETDAEGPGRRFALWVQGCAIRCDGCFNPQMWSADGGVEMPVDELLAMVESSDVEGITFLGGEPFEQAVALSVLAAGVRALGRSVMTFTGHELEHLVSETAPIGSSALIGVTDLLVTGPYLAAMPDHARPWVGSSNQQFHFLTQRYSYLGNQLSDLPDRVEVRVAPDGKVSVNGWAVVAQLDELLADLSRPIGRGRVR